MQLFIIPQEKIKNKTISGHFVWKTGFSFKIEFNGQVFKLRMCTSRFNGGREMTIICQAQPACQTYVLPYNAQKRA